ncbi:MAG: glycosyl hydrolase family 65 protein [Prolixibacteraceae bacterium]
MARYRLNEGEERAKDYNHSTYCDLIISGLVGIRPQPGNEVVINPLILDDEWDWFCLDNVSYHGSILTIVWDKFGNRYGKGKRLIIFSNGKEIARNKILGKTKEYLDDDKG